MLSCRSKSKTVPISYTFLQNADMILFKTFNTSTWGGQLCLTMTDGIRPPTIVAQITCNYPDSILWELADQIYSSEYSNMFYLYPQAQQLLMFRNMAPQVMAKLEYTFPATADVELIYRKFGPCTYCDSFVPNQSIANQSCPECNYQWLNCKNRK